jgi:hypothetical protein
VSSTAATPTIEIMVLPDGTVRVETKGFAGAKCRAASQFVEEALGLSQSEQLTADFYATSSTQQQVTERH